VRRWGRARARRGLTEAEGWVVALCLPAIGFAAIDKIITANVHQLARMCASLKRIRSIASRTIQKHAMPLPQPVRPLTRVVMDRMSGRSKGFGFVEMEDVWRFYYVIWQNHAVILSLAAFISGIISQ
jgi:hypothetical protein